MDIKDHFVLQLYQAKTMDELSWSAMHLLQEHIPSHFSTISYFPFSTNNGFAYYNDEKFKDNMLLYEQLGGAEIDVWYQRCPSAEGKVNVSRHSNNTDRGVLLNSIFYEEILKPHNLMYGAVINGFEKGNMLFHLSPVRTAEEGDFTDKEMELMLKIQRHVYTAVERLLFVQEAMLRREALQAMIKSIPVAALILNWDLEVYLQNDIAKVFCLQWGLEKKEDLFEREKEVSYSIELPPDLKWALVVFKKEIEQQAREGGASSQDTLKRRVGGIRSKKNGMVASIDFLPSRTLSFSRGYFLIRLERESLRQQNDSDLYEKWAQLSSSERYIAELVAQGFTNQQIALDLGKSAATIRNQLHSIFAKLGIQKRQEIVSLLR